MPLWPSPRGPPRPPCLRRQSGRPATAARRAARVFRSVARLRWKRAHPRSAAPRHSLAVVRSRERRARAGAGRVRVLVLGALGLSCEQSVARGPRGDIPGSESQPAGFQPGNDFCQARTVFLVPRLAAVLDLREVDEHFGQQPVSVKSSCVAAFGLRVSTRGRRADGQLRPGPRARARSARSQSSTGRRCAVRRDDDLDQGVEAELSVASFTSG